MARSGQVIENPRTQERIVFRRTSQDTNGELLEIDFFVRPGGFAPRSHIHADVEERFLMVKGELKVTLAGSEQILLPGDRATVPPGPAHTFQALGDEMVHFIAEIQPARDMETLFETIWGLYADGKTNSRGWERFLQGAVLAREHRAFMGGPPVALQKPVVGTLAFLGRRLGYRARYARYSGTD